MAKTIFVVGGSRSGKSDYAQALAERGSAPLFYLATCPSPSFLDVGDGLPATSEDPEMFARIKEHQRRRQASLWQTVEEPLLIASALQSVPDHATVLIDCLTLWISNLLFAARSGVFGEEQIAVLASELVTVANERRGQTIVVSSEVGSGIVPDHPISRAYRDLVGRCNQLLAAGAEQVIQVVCGLPIILKGEQQ